MSLCKERQSVFALKGLSSDVLSTSFKRGNWNFTYPSVCKQMLYCCAGYLPEATTNTLTLNRGIGHVEEGAAKTVLLS